MLFNNQVLRLAFKLEPHTVAISSFWAAPAQAEPQLLAEQPLASASCYLSPRPPGIVHIDSIRVCQCQVDVWRIIKGWQVGAINAKLSSSLCREVLPNAQALNLNTAQPCA